MSSSSARRRSSGASGASGSRSPSPNPSGASSFSRRSSTVGMTMTSGTTLSKESLYAPLTTYLPKAKGTAAAKDDDDATASGSGKGRKSPTSADSLKFLNIPRELREPALLDHLSTISSTYHHPTLSASLMSGGSGSSDGRSPPQATTPRAMGMGRNNGGQAMPRRSYEDRLTQRSLVLVGGGLMTSVVGTDGIAAATNGGVGADGGDRPMSRHVVDVSRSQRRRRRKDRGHRVRGSISNSERKRREMEASIPKEGGEDVQKEGLCKKRKRTAATPAHETLLRLNDMWNTYTSKLLGLEQDANGASTATTKKSIRKRSAAELSTLLSTAELIGAFVKIDRCDSSKSYVGKEGIVVGCTANTWRIAIPEPVMGRAKKKQNNKCDGRGDIDVEKKSDNGTKDMKLLGIIWREVVVPKHRSRLSFSVDLDIETSNETKFSFMIGEPS